MTFSATHRNRGKGENGDRFFFFLTEEKKLARKKGFAGLFLFAAFSLSLALNRNDISPLSLRCSGLGVFFLVSE